MNEKKKIIWNGIKIKWQLKFTFISNKLCAFECESEMLTLIGFSKLIIHSSLVITAKLTEMLQFETIIMDLNCT